MRKIYAIFLALLLTLTIWAQSPQKMSYQAVIRNNSNVLVISSPIGMKISILQGSSTGTPVYVETQTPTSNENGLVSIEIGGGTPITGTIAGIDWSAGSYFIKTETDPAGGTNYDITGTSQLLSVPYALYAKTADTHHIGESYGGGIVFYVYDNGKHGLISATADQSTGIRWYGGSYTITRARADGVGAGLKNTAIIIANHGHVDGNAFAAAVCNEYSVTVGGVTYGDWYLPSKYELNLLYLQKAVVGGFSSNYYWSSTEYDNNSAWDQYFSGGSQYVYFESSTYNVRAVRAF